MCALYEQVKSSEGQKASEVRFKKFMLYNITICFIYIRLEKKLPCTSVELKLAKKPNPSATINNLIKCCFKNVDLKTMCYEKLKANNQQLLEQIYSMLIFFSIRPQSSLFLLIKIMFSTFMLLQKYLNRCFRLLYLSNASSSWNRKK